MYNIALILLGVGTLANSIAILILSHAMTKSRYIYRTCDERLFDTKSAALRNSHYYIVRMKKDVVTDEYVDDYMEDMTDYIPPEI